MIGLQPLLEDIAKEIDPGRSPYRFEEVPIARLGQSPRGAARRLLAEFSTTRPGGNEY